LVKEGYVAVDQVLKVEVIGEEDIKDAEDGRFP
jgi:hypothetical protein